MGRKSAKFDGVEVYQVLAKRLFVHIVTPPTTYDVYLLGAYRCVSVRFRPVSNCERILFIFCTAGSVARKVKLVGFCGVRSRHGHHFGEAAAVPGLYPAFCGRLTQNGGPGWPVAKVHHNDSNHELIESSRNNSGVINLDLAKYNTSQPNVFVARPCVTDCTLHCYLIENLYYLHMQWRRVGVWGWGHPP